MELGSGIRIPSFSRVQSIECLFFCVMWREPVISPLDAATMLRAERLVPRVWARSSM